MGRIARTALPRSLLTTMVTSRVALVNGSDGLPQFGAISGRRSSDTGVSLSQENLTRITTTAVCSSSHCQRFSRQEVKAVSDLHS
jgi:hypothetical protein